MGAHRTPKAVWAHAHPQKWPCPKAPLAGPGGSGPVSTRPGAGPFSGLSARGGGFGGSCCENIPVSRLTLSGCWGLRARPVRPLGACRFPPWERFPGAPCPADPSGGLVSCPSVLPSLEPSALVLRPLPCLAYVRCSFLSAGTRWAALFALQGDGGHWVTTSAQSG